MISKAKRVTINTKITEEESAKLHRLADRGNLSVNAVLRLCVDGLLNGDIEIDRGEIKSCPTHDKQWVSAISEEEFQENLRYKELKVDRLVGAFEKRGYPDRAIRQSIEQIVRAIVDSGNYNPRRGYDSECGC